MLDLISIENTLRTWIVNATGINTIFAHPNAPRPGGEYAVLNIILITQNGTKEYIATELINESIDVEYSSIDELMVSINTYRDNAQMNATKIKDSLSRITVLDALWAGGIGFIRAGSINEIDEVINKKWESRAQLDCFFYVRNTDSENIETIKKIHITNEIDGYETTIQQ